MPFLALLFLAVTAVRQPLHGAQWTVIGIYLLYLLPYVAVSYYERYAMPLVGVKALLVIWGVDRLLSFALPGRTVGWPPRARPRTSALAAADFQPGAGARLD